MSFSLTLLPEATAQRQALRQQILALSTQPAHHDAFTALALAVFRYQAAFNPLYASYLHHLNVEPEQISALHQIPFVPIGFFKKHPVLTGTPFISPTDLHSTLTFASSGTTGEQTSRHYVPDTALYATVSQHIFEQLYGPLQHMHILALLPSYLERNNSSLVYMVQQFMQHAAVNSAGEPTGGFFLNNHRELTDRLKQLIREPDQKKILLIGVTFGLLDWAETEPDLTFLGQSPKVMVMETGGMKGRRKELLREEVHALLSERLGIATIHSEYGMTELLSQAYSTGQGIFQPSATLRILLRDINDPFCIYPETGMLHGQRRTGGINVIDLANLDSCSFIETQDLGQYVDTEGNFRVIGRFDNSDVRGCNLMIE